MRVRFRAHLGHRVELAEADGPDIRLGSSPECQVILHHPSVADVHAHILLRRGRLIVRSSGRRGAHLNTDGSPVSAPILLDRNTALTVGEIELRAWPSARPGLSAEALGVRIRGEVHSRCSLARCYRIDDQSEAFFMPRTDLVRTWQARTEATRREASAHLARRKAVHALGDHLAVVDDVTNGLRLSALHDAIRRGVFPLSPSAAVVIAGHTALGLKAHHTVIGPHGNVDPEHIQVGVDGSSVLLTAGPKPSVNLNYAAPERRLGLGPSRASDAYAWARIAFELMSLAGSAERGRATLARLLVANPRRRDRDIAEAARRLSETYFDAGHDAGAQDAGRLARLLVGDGLARLLDTPPHSAGAS